MTAQLTAFAADQQQRFEISTSAQERKQRGHFGTSPSIATYMAGMFSKIPRGTVRVLDAGAGVGTLSAAVCQRVLMQKSPRTLFLELWENDPKLAPLLEKTMRRCQATLQESGHQMDFVVRIEDFILANTKGSLFDSGPLASFHLTILNPPYYKLRKDSQYARAMKHVVHGQPNIYALFMAVAADLLLPNGEMVAITPRSYFNGLYFMQFRRWFFDRMTARRIHVFDSRTEAFKESAVLQENVILGAEKTNRRGDVKVTTSKGRALVDLEERSHSYDSVIDESNGDRVVRVATSRLAQDIVKALDDLPCRFRRDGFEVSTGPVVTFRATEFLRHERTDDTAPLLWMHNIRPFITRFPSKNEKPSHIEVSDLSRKVLVPARTYVLLKRFTAKEEKRRLVAGVIRASDSYSEWLGLENHLNYVYRSGAELSQFEAFGLAAYFNSALLDRYFRAISGNTQVNATEIRGMPVPDDRTLCQIGMQITRLETKVPEAVERIVGESLGFRRGLIEKLIKIAQ